MSRILFAAFLAFAWAVAADDKPKVDTVDADTLRQAQSRLQAKSGGGGDLDALRAENERLRIENAALKRELAAMRKAAGVQPVKDWKGHPLDTTDKRIAFYLDEHPDTPKEVADAMRQQIPVPGMTLDQVRVFTALVKVRAETIGEQTVTIGVNREMNGYVTTSSIATVRKSDGVILKVIREP